MATIATRSLGFSIHSSYDGSGVRRARRDVDDFTRSVNRSSSALNSSSGRFMLYAKAALMFGPALMPITANLTALAGAATVMGTALAAGLGVYAAAATDAINTTLALEGSGKKLTGIQKTFLSNFHAMGEAWTKFTQATQSTTLIAANNVIAGLTKLIPLLKQQFDAVAPSIQKVTQLFQNWASSDRPKQYSAILAEMSKSILPNLISAGRDLINVLGDGFRAFAPRAVELSKAIKDGARSLREWSDGGGFQRFLQYARETSPQVGEFFRALKDAIKNLGAAVKELGPFSLGLTTNLLKLVAALPPELIANIVKGFVAWRAAMAGLMIIRTLTSLVMGLRAAWFILSIAFMGTPLGWIVAGVAALVAAIVLIATKTTWFQTAWKYTWNAVKVAAEAVWNALKTAWNAVVTALQTAWTAVSSALSTAWNAVWNALKTAAQAVWTALQTAWNAVVTALQTAWTTVSTALVTAWNAVWNGLQTAAQAVWTALQTAWNAFISALQTVWTTVSTALTTAWSAVWTGLQTAAQAVWTAIQVAWQAVCTAFQTVWSAISGALQAAWSAFWNALQTAAQAIWTALQAAWNAFLNVVQTVWNTVSSVIRTAWQAFWTALQTAAQTVWNFLQTAWQTFLNAVQTVWNTVSSAIRSAWDTFWNAIKTFVEGIWQGLQQAWDTFLNAIQTAWDTASETLMNAIETVWNTIKDTATEVWDGIKGVIGDAVNGIIDIINSIIGAWNSITDAVGLDSLNIGEIGHVNFAVGGVVTFSNGGMVGGEPTHFARGGVIPGYAPGKDTVHAMLSKGEGVLVPEAVRGLGPDFVHAANYYFSHGRGGQNVSFPGYAGGGIAAFGRDPQGHMGWGTSFFQGGGVIGPTPGPGIGGAPTGPGLGTVGENGVEGVGQKAADDGDDGGGFGGFIKDAASGVAGVLTGGMIGDGGGVANLVLGFIGREAIEAAFDAVMGMLDNFGMAGDFGKILVQGTRKIVEMMIEDLVRRDEAAKQEFEAMAVAGAQSVGAWSPLAAQALALAGLSPSQLPAFLALMAAESGGNPNAINNWDINAANGVPSQGLMQVIPPTFAAYHVAGTSNNILDPLANMAAAANYIRNRYGGVVPGSPYADGTDSATPGMHLVGEEGPELVTSPGYAMFGGGEQVLNAADTAAALGGGAGAAPAASGAFAMGGGFTGGAGGSVETPDDAYALIQQLIESAQLLQQLLPSMWSQVVSTTDSSWKTMSSGTFAPLNTNLAGTVPTSMTAMKTAWMAGMTEVGTATTTQWAAMDSMAFTPMNAMMTATVPASAASMNTAVTGSTQQMQGSVQASWGQMETGTEQSWTNIEGSITDSVTAATTPINGLLTGFNNVSSSLGMGVTVPLIAFAEGGLVPAFAGGGMLHKKGGALPGYAPGKDRIPAMLSPGEGVLTPEAVRGLGGPSFVYAANKKFSGHRGAGKGGPSMSHFATGGMAMSTQKRLLPGGVPDPHSGRQLFFSGTITPQVAAGLAEAGIPTSMVSQGSFSTGVAASAGTHDGDGVADISSTSVEAQMRNVGWAAWTRGNGDGMSPHTHGVLMSASGMSPAAMWQVLDFINGGSGLGVGSASAGELAGWGLGLGRWDFGPLIKDLVNTVKTNVPPLLRPIVLKKLSRDQVASGFAEKKAALDAMAVGSGPWADGLRGMGTKSHDGAVNYIASRATSFDRGGWWQPGTFGYNGTGKPELAVPADDLEVIANSIKGQVGHDGDCAHIEINFNGPVSNAEDVRRAINDEAIPKLRALLQQGVGHHN